MLSRRFLPFAQLKRQVLEACAGNQSPLEERILIRLRMLCVLCVFVFVCVCVCAPRQSYVSWDYLDSRGHAASQTPLDDVMLAQVFALVGNERYMFPTRHGVGRSFIVPLPPEASHLHTSRTVNATVVSDTPGVLVIPDFLEAFECDEIRAMAEPKMARSKVQATGLKSAGGIKKAVMQDR